MKDFRELKSWHKSYSLALSVYEATKHFPKDELYGLVSQLRRASVSVTANIAEGCGREEDSEFCRFLQIANGSATELECELLLARDLGYLNKTDAEQLLKSTDEVRRMLASLIRKVRSG